MPYIHHRALGKGPPIIFLHGFCETGEIWDPFVARVSDRCQAIILDLPGFGGSPLPKGNLSLVEIGAALNEWVLRQKFKNPIVLGHSLGGYVCLAMAAQMPEAYAALGLIHSTARADTDEKRLNRTKVMEFVKAHGARAFVDTFVPGLFYRKDHPSMNFVHKIALQTTEATLLAYTAAMRDRPSREGFIGGFGKPILMVGGKEDPLIPVGSLEGQAALNAKASLHILEDVGHMGMFEAKDKLANIVIHFVSSVENGSGA